MVPLLQCLAMMVSDIAYRMEMDPWSDVRTWKESDETTKIDQIDPQSADPGEGIER